MDLVDQYLLRFFPQCISPGGLLLPIPFSLLAAPQPFPYCVPFTPREGHSQHGVVLELGLAKRRSVLRDQEELGAAGAELLQGLLVAEGVLTGQSWSLPRTSWTSFKQQSLHDPSTSWTLSVSTPSWHRGLSARRQTGMISPRLNNAPLVGASIAMLAPSHADSSPFRILSLPMPANSKGSSTDILRNIFSRIGFGRRWV